MSVFIIRSAFSTEYRRNAKYSASESLYKLIELSYKSCDFSENVRPMAVICALHRLMNESDLYKNSGITIDDEKWIEELNEENINENYDLSDYIEKESNEESDDEKFSETDESESHVGNVDTFPISQCLCIVQAHVCLYYQVCFFHRI
jgi:hypothetical protein